MINRRKFLGGAAAAGVAGPRVAAEIAAGIVPPPGTPFLGGATALNQMAEPYQGPRGIDWVRKTGRLPDWSRRELQHHSRQMGTDALMQRYPDIGALGSFSASARRAMALDAEVERAERMILNRDAISIIRQEWERRFGFLQMF